MLNTTHYKHLAGNTSFDDEMRTRTTAGESLFTLQEEFFRRGRAEAEVVKTLNGYSVRYVSGLHDRAIIAKGCKSYEEAVLKGRAWVEGDDRRSLIVRNSTIPKEG
jgi:hypothetical protein